MQGGGRKCEGELSSVARAPVVMLGEEQQEFNDSILHHGGAPLTGGDLDYCSSCRRGDLPRW
jgi:hypothetical protein